MLALLRAAYAGRADTALAASVEQALPVQPAWLNFNRLRLRAERSLPLGAGVSAQLCAKGAAYFRALTCVNEGVEHSGPVEVADDQLACQRKAIAAIWHLAFFSSAQDGRVLVQS